MTVDITAHRHVHFVGIGGIGMSALARFLLARGHEVSGSDAQHNDQVEALEESGAVVHDGHAAENIGGADLVVVTSAARQDNPEIDAARKAGVPVVKRAELLAAIANAGRGIAVAGTHGKTTTSALIGHILVEEGLDPTILIGGISTTLGSNARVGESDWVVVEADEYDRSFLHLRPEIAVITNVEPDHLDIYGTAEEVRAAFRQFASGAKTVFACADDLYMDEVLRDLPGAAITYGIEHGAWRASEIEQGPERTRFLAGTEGVTAEYTTQLAGLHNVRNATAAAIVATACGLTAEATAEAIASFGGVQRRFEQKGEAAGVLVMDDYAHHPTEIRTNLDALRTRFSRPIRLVFQPHTFSRTEAFFDDFAHAFDGATAVYLMDIYAARETDTRGMHSRDLAEAAGRAHRSVRYTGGEDETVAALLKDAKPGDLVITMGAGDVHRVGTALLERLKT